MAAESLVVVAKVVLGLASSSVRTAVRRRDNFAVDVDQGAVAFDGCDRDAGRGDRRAATVAERYERARPGELIHIDVNKLGRIARPGHRVLGRQSAGGHHRRGYDHGWEFVHVCIDDASGPSWSEGEWTGKAP